jgi:ketosteroid isomerase-like protein
MSSDSKCQQFISRLRQCERDNDPSALVDLFADDAVVDTPVRSAAYSGKAGAERFWSNYLETFNRVESHFHTTLEFGDIAVLEWECRGILPTGRPIDYSGVSIVEFGKDESIKRFATYYDTAPFLQPSPTPRQYAAA